MQEFITFAEKLAQASGEVIKLYFRSDLTVDSKGDGTPVTIADKTAEKVMREMIKKEFPLHGILGEEFDDHQPDAEYQWILDPIDGTKTFITGVPLFGTLIGLLQKGRPILGMIHNPILEQMLIGVNGETRLNGKIVRVRPTESIATATVLCTSHWSVSKYGRDMAAFEAFTQRAKLYRSWGDCYGYYLVATGYADIMLDPAMSPWDLLPLIPIIKGAGGIITDWYGDDPINGQGAVATTGSIHDDVIRALNP